MKPRLLDLFCGAGGAAMGYSRAGFEVVGVDVRPHPNYPFEFIQAEALGFLEQLRDGWYLHKDGVHEDWALIDFDAIHASPPCQFATDYQRTGLIHEHENLIPGTRRLIHETRLPYVIENVEKARPWLVAPVRLCGSMFDLDVRRHRLFETNWNLVPGWGCRHRIWSRRYPAATNRRPNSRYTVEIGVRRIPLTVQKRAMGVDWEVTREELSQAVPPAYTELIGHQLMQHIQARAA